MRVIEHRSIVAAQERPTMPHREASDGYVRPGAWTRRRDLGIPLLMLPHVLRPVCAMAFSSLVALATLGCADDVPAMGLRKGEIDRETLESGVTVTLASTQVGAVAVPFLTPVPTPGGDTGGGGDDLEDELSDAVTFVVMSDASGTNANLTSGIIVDGTPSGAGQWRWQLNDDRDRADITFYNATVNGLTLQAGNAYTATLSITTNDYVASEPSFTFPVTVIAN